VTGAGASERGRRIAVAIHDVEPATFERCALIRDWLADHGIDRATLLVIPAPDLHPFFQRRPDPWTPTRPGRASRRAGACSRSPAWSRAGSSRRPTRTRPRCGAS
jgi:hypothetical protein